MGLIKAATGAVGSETEDYIYCESLDGSALMRRGYPKSSGGAGASASNGVVTDGSRVAVNDGQFLIIVENGKIADFSAEEGEYIFRADAAPSLFCGQLGEGLKNTFAGIGQRSAFGGSAPNDRRAYFVSTKEIPNNKFGFGNIPFRDGEFNITVILRGFGMYSYRIVDPLLFYANVCGNAETFTAADPYTQMRAELQNSLLPALGKLSDKNIGYDKIPLEVPALSKLLNDELSLAWETARGINVGTLVFSNITPDEQSAVKIRQMREARAYSETASGAVGTGMAGSAGGAYPNAPQAAPPTELPKNPKEWQCSCGLLNDAKICPKCGAVRPQMCLSCGYRFDEPKDADVCPRCGKEMRSKGSSAGTSASVPQSARSAQPKPPTGPRVWQCACGFMNDAKICPKCGAVRPD